MSLVVNRDKIQKIIQETICKKLLPEKLPVSYSSILLTDENIYKIIKNYNKNTKKNLLAKRYIWEVPNVTNIELFFDTTFNNVTNFDGDITYRNVNENIKNKNICNVTTIAEMFCNATYLYRPINNWYVPNVTNMENFKSKSDDIKLKYETTTTIMKNETKSNETKNVIVNDDNDDVNSEEDSDDSDDSEGSLVDFIVDDNMSETEDDLTTTNDESDLDCVNLIESSNYNRHGVRRSLRSKKQTILFTEQFAADIAKTMLSDIPDEELQTAIINNNLTSDDEESSLLESDEESEFEDDGSESESDESESDESESDKSESDKSESD